MDQTTRRAALRGAVSAIVSAPLLALPAVAVEPDPIFAAIENHKRLWDELGEVIREEKDLWDILPSERRSGGANDDPRWAAFQDRVDAAGDAAEDAAWASGRGALAASLLRNC